MDQNHNQGQEILWYQFNMAEEREFKKAVKWVQKICRGSLEYDLWQGRTKAGEQICPTCAEYYGYLPSETHHHPKTMYDVCEEVVNKHMFENDLDQYSGFAICTEIMNLHFLGAVDYVVLCKSCHEKFHAGHPEVCTKVAEVYKSKKEGKPVEVFKDSETNEVGDKIIVEEEIEKEMEKEPEIFTGYKGGQETTMFVNSNGIEIDI
jgi:hypothetical protein